MTSSARRFLMFPFTRLVVATGVFFVLQALAIVALVLVAETLTFLVLEAALAVAALGTLLFLGLVVERRPPAEFGIGGKGAGRELLAGCGIGAAIMTVVVLVLAAAGWYRIDSFADEAGRALPLLLGHAALIYLAVSVFEEIIFRGIAFRLVEEMIGSWGALVATGAIFGLIHLGNPNATWMGAFGISVSAGLLLGASYMVTRALWMPIGIHWTWNLFQGSIYGMPVSGVGEEILGAPSLIKAQVRGPEIFTGGNFGPEAGVIVMALGVAVGIWLLTRAAKENEFVSPMWRTTP